VLGKPLDDAMTQVELSTVPFHWRSQRFPLSFHERRPFSCSAQRDSEDQATRLPQ
jgi:hypothetical protein